MELRRGCAVCIGFLLTLLNVCCGLQHSSDSNLEHTFWSHQNEFENLLADVQADEKFGMVHSHGLTYAGRSLRSELELNVEDVERLGLAKERWRRYQMYLQNLGLRGGIFKGDGRVEFRVDPGSLFNGDSYKGYWYASTPPGHFKASLDDYQLAAGDKDRFGNWEVFRTLKGHWYLYLLVNGSDPPRGRAGNRH